MEVADRIELSYALRKQGYNCAQCVIAAYSDILDITQEQAIKISYGFGGGFGGQRELCGCLSGAAMVVGMLFGQEQADLKLRKEIYQKITKFCDDFESKYHSKICAELLGINKKEMERVHKTCNDLIVHTIEVLNGYILYTSID